MVCIVFPLVERKGEREAGEKKKLGQTGEQKRHVRIQCCSPRRVKVLLYSWVEMHVRSGWGVVEAAYPRGFTY